MKRLIKVSTIIIFSSLLIACPTRDPGPIEPVGECPDDGSKENCTHAEEVWMDYPACQCVLYGEEPGTTLDPTGDGGGSGDGSIDIDR